MKNKIYLIGVCVILVIFVASATQAQVPPTITYQGRLLDNTGTPISGDYDISFRIVSTKTGSDVVVWESGTQSIPIAGGVFTYELGSAVLLPDDIFAGDTTCTLGIKIDTDPEIAPRTKLNSVAFAFHSLRSDTAGYATSVADNSVNGDKISSASIAAPHIINGAITSAKIQDQTILLSDIAQNGATIGQVISWNGSTWELVDNEGDISSVSAGSGLTGGGTSGDVSLSISYNSVTSEMIKDDAVVTKDIAANAITGSQIADGAVANADLANNAVNSAKIQNASITAADLGASSVYSTEIADGTIVTDDLANSAVTSAKIANGSVSADDLGTGSVAADEIATGAVGASEIAPGAVGASEIATDAVNYLEIKTDAVRAAEIQANAVGASEIAADAVGASEIAPGAVGTTELALSAVNSSKISDEPGVAQSISMVETVINMGQLVTLRSRTISCPSAGYVLAIGSAYIQADHKPIPPTYFSSVFVLGVSDSAKLYSEQAGKAWSIPNAVLTATYANTMSSAKLFPVSAGNKTFYLMGLGIMIEPSGNMFKADNMTLSLVFFPTNYGTVSVSPEDDENQPPVNDQ